MAVTLSSTSRNSPPSPVSPGSQHRPFKRQKLDGRGASSLIPTNRSYDQTIQQRDEGLISFHEPMSDRTLSALGANGAKKHPNLEASLPYTENHVATGRIDSCVPISPAQSSPLNPFSQALRQNSTHMTLSVHDQLPVLATVEIEPVKPVFMVSSRADAVLNAQTAGMEKKIPAVSQSNVVSSSKEASLDTQQLPSSDYQTSAQISRVFPCPTTPLNATATSASENSMVNILAPTPKSPQLGAIKHRVSSNPPPELSQSVSGSDKSMGIDSNIIDVSRQSVTPRDIGPTHPNESTSQQYRKSSVEIADPAVPVTRRNTDFSNLALPSVSSEKDQVEAKNDTESRKFHLQNKEVYHSLIQSSETQPPTKSEKMDTADSGCNSQSCRSSVPNLGTQTSKLSPRQGARASYEEIRIRSPEPSPKIPCKNNMVPFPLCTSCGTKRVFSTAKVKETDVLW